MKHTDLSDAINAITGLSGVTSYSLAIYDLDANPRPLRLALQAITEHVTNATLALDELDTKADATVTHIFPEDTPA